MFVTNHVFSGVVVGRLLERRPVTAFVAGVGSHLVLDMVPHWGCDALHGRPAALPPIREAGWSAGARRGRSRNGSGGSTGAPGNNCRRCGCGPLGHGQAALAFLGSQPVPYLGQADPFGGPARVATGLAKRDRLRTLVRPHRRGDCSSWSPTPDRHASILYIRKTINSMGIIGFNTIVRQPPFPTPDGRDSSSAAPDDLKSTVATVWS